jgi:hypothetical protein
MAVIRFRGMTAVGIACEAEQNTYRTAVIRWNDVVLAFRKDDGKFPRGSNGRSPE